MHQVPPVDLAIKINKIINRNRTSLKEYQDNYGKVNFNLLIGLMLGGICSFADKPMLNDILGIFFPVFNDSQLSSYADLMMELNNYLVFTLDTNPHNIYLLEDNKWVLIADANLDSVYALWYAFFGIMTVEFSAAKNKIKKLQNNNNSAVSEAMEGYNVMHKIMKSPALGIDDINTMQTAFPQYAHKFNELRKLMYLQTTKPHYTLH